MKFEHFETNLEKENEYPKLVRDLIPEIIKARTGENAKTRILEIKEEYLAFLLKKVEEEAHELANAKDKEHIVEEVADVLELIESILDFYDVDMETVLKVKNEKAGLRGGFKKRILMLEKV